MKKWLLAVFLAMFVCPASAEGGLPDFSQDVKKFNAQISHMATLVLPTPAPLPRSVDAFSPHPEKTLRDIVHRLAEHAGVGDIENRVFIDTTNDFVDFDCQTHAPFPRGGGYIALTALCSDGEYIVFGNALFTIYHSVDDLAFTVAHEFSHVAAGHMAETMKIISMICHAWQQGSGHDEAAAIEKEIRRTYGVLDEEALKSVVRNAVFVRCLEKPENRALLDAFKRRQEDRADAEALDLLRLAGFDPLVAKAHFLHFLEHTDARDKVETDGQHDVSLKRAGKVDGYNTQWLGNP